MVSPITGRIGISQVTEGAYVQENSTLLATIQQLDPRYVDVVQASGDLLRLRKEFAGGKLKTDETGRARGSSSKTAEDTRRKARWNSPT